MTKFSVREGTFSCCRIFIFFLLLTLTAFASIPEQCPQLNFPEISPGTRVTKVEGSTINLPFKLDTSQCSDNVNKNIYVYVVQPSGYDFCVVRLKPIGCRSTSKEKCPCVDTRFADKGAVLTKSMTKKDNGVWVWRTGDGAVITNITFDVQEQPGGTDFCAVWLKPEGCDSFSKNNCACVDGNSADKGAVLTKIVTKEDKGAWVWRTGDGAARTTLMFAVQAAIAVPPTVKDAERDQETTRKATNNDVIFTSTFQVESTFNPEIDLKSQGGNVETKEDDDDEDGFVDSSMKTGLFVSGAHIIAFVFIAFVGFICRRKRKRRGRRRPNRKLPPLPIDLIGDEVTPMQGPGNDAGSNMTSGHYEDIPDTYEHDRVASECPVEEEDDVMQVGRRPEPLVGLIVNDYELPGRTTSRTYDMLPGAVNVQTDDYSDKSESGYGYEIVV